MIFDKYYIKKNKISLNISILLRKPYFTFTHLLHFFLFRKLKTLELTFPIKVQALNFLSQV